LKNTLYILLLLHASFLWAQNDPLHKITFSGYGEAYYSYDFSNPPSGEKANFIYNHKRHNEINTNLILAKAAFKETNIRANLSLMTGNYAQYNLQAEPTWAQWLYEANLGVKISKKHHLWLDAGIMPSHIGFESAISGDCWTLTRSILAENSPYYETGLKISYTNKKENLNLAFLVLNGWQHIKTPNYIKTPSIGMQMNYQFNNHCIFNYSNFIGAEKAGDSSSIRTFHNFYLQLEPKDKMGVIAGFDIGSDRYNTADYGIWFSPVLIVRYPINDKIKVAFRGEYYNDQHQIIIPTNSPNGFQVSGVSTNFDFKVNERLQFRLEGKVYDAKDPIFLNNSDENYSVTTNMTIKL
jgi:hypothetical protein